VLVFSQFTEILERMKRPLEEEGFQHRSLRGDMTMPQRKKALRDFQSDPPTTIFLLSMRAGAVGINLTQANHVIILDPCLNEALELQAIGRVHRMGQRREVHIHRLVMEGTIESRIVRDMRGLGVAPAAGAAAGVGVGANAVKADPGANGANGGANGGAGAMEVDEGLDPASAAVLARAEAALAEGDEEPMAALRDNGDGRDDDDDEEYMDGRTGMGDEDEDVDGDGEMYRPRASTRCGGILACFLCNA
jgi:hypothetical protein